MSSGADCRFLEVEPGKWSYELQRYPYGETGEYDKFGPFGSFGAAQRHLDTHHQNPGGWSVDPHLHHRHEWVEGSAQVPVGVEASIRIESLGPEPSKDDVMALLESGSAKVYEALRVRTAYGYKDGVVVCDACGQVKE